MNGFYDSLMSSGIGMENRNVLLDKNIRINDGAIYVGEKGRTETTMLFPMLVNQNDTLELFKKIKTNSGSITLYRLLIYYMPNILRIQLPTKKLIKNYTKMYTDTMKKKSDYEITTVVNNLARVKNASCVYDMSFVLSAIKGATVDAGLQLNRKQRTAIIEILKDEIISSGNILQNKVIYFKGPFFAGTSIKFNIQESHLLRVFNPLLLFLEWFKNDPEDFKKWLQVNQLTMVFEGATGKSFVLSGRKHWTKINNFTFVYVMRLLHMVDGKPLVEIDKMVSEELNDEEKMNLIEEPDTDLSVDENESSELDDTITELNILNNKKENKADEVIEKDSIVNQMKDKVFKNIRGVDTDKIMKGKTYMVEPDAIDNIVELEDPMEVVKIETDAKVIEDISDIEVNQSLISVKGKEKDYFSILESNLPEEEKAVELIEQHNYTQLKDSIETPEIAKMRKTVIKNSGRTVEEIVKDIKTHELDIEEYKNVDPDSSYRRNTVHNLGKSYREKIAQDEFKNIVNLGSNLTYPVFTVNMKETDKSDREFLGKEVELTMVTHNGVKLDPIKLDIPEVRDNKVFIGGSWKYISMQNLPKVVIKTDNNVIYTTSYNKVITELSGKYPNMRVKQVVMTLKAYSKYSSILKVKTTDELGEFIYNNLVSYNLIHLNVHFSGCVDENMNIDLRGLGKDDDTGLTNLGHIGGEKVLHDPEKDIILYKGKEYDSIEFFITVLRSQNPEVFDECVVKNVSTSGINTPYAKIMNKRIPIILLLCIAMPFKDLLEKLKNENNLEYKIVKNGPVVDKLKNNDKYGIIRLKDYSIVMKYNNNLNEILLTFLTELDLKSYDTFDITNIMEDYAGNANTSLYIENFIDLFIDPETSRVCKLYNIPDDFVGLFIYGCSLFTSYKTSRKSDIRNYRVITVDEIINRCVYDVLAKELSDNAARVKRGSRAKVVVPRDAVIKKLQSLPSLSEANSLSPFRVISANSEVTFKGHMGINEPRAFTTDVRAFNPNNLGTETTATSYSGNAGVTKHLPFNPVINDVTGSYEYHPDVSTLDPSNLHSFVESYVPYSSSDHIVRRIMMSGWYKLAT